MYVCMYADDPIIMATAKGLQKAINKRVVFVKMEVEYK